LYLAENLFFTNKETMVETESISITRTAKSRLSKTDFNSLSFGQVFTDHMFMADYRDGQWKNLRIVPYGPIQISPATPALHYGQSIFEGMKAYRADDGKALVFRAADNLTRMNISGNRMCMPAVPEDLFMEALSTLIDLDRAWIPNQEGSSLYIRPFMFFGR
jgi:branched-chain amino acid aminotransferase